MKVWVILFYLYTHFSVNFKCISSLKFLISICLFVSREIPYVKNVILFFSLQKSLSNFCLIQCKLYFFCHNSFTLSFAHKKRCHITRIHRRQYFLRRDLSARYGFPVWNLRGPHWCLEGIHWMISGICFLFALRQCRCWESHLERDVDEFCEQFSVRHS